MKIKYDASLMQFMNVFASMTGAELKDCFIDQKGLLVFVVREAQIGRAIGKDGFRVRRIEAALNRKIKIVEFNPDLVAFIKNMIYPLRAAEVTVDSGRVVIQPADLTTRGLLIGRAAQNLRNLEYCVRRYFEIEEIRVI